MSFNGAIALLRLKRSSVIAIAASGLFVDVALAQTPEPAGVVIIAAGNVVAVAQGNAARPLQRKSPFYVGDVIQVAEGGQSQVRFRDGTILSLTSGTELRVDAFEFSADATRDSNVVTLLKGGFRTITGAIAKRNPQAQQIATPLATIGVRGTHYSVVLQDTMYVGVWSGVVTVNNDAGGIELGADRSFNYAQVSAANDAPQGLLQAPAALMQTAAPTVIATAEEGETGTSEEAPAEQAAAGTATGDGAATSSNDETGGAETATDSTTEAGAKTADNATSDTTDAAATPTATTDETAVESWAALADGGAKVGAPLTSDTTGGITSDQTFTNLTTDALSDFAVDTTVGTIEKQLAETRYTADEAVFLNYYGLAVAGGTVSKVFEGRASNGEEAAPLIVDNGLLPSDSLYLTQLANDVLRLDAATNSYLAVYDTHDAVVGEWVGALGSPFISQTDATDPTIHTDYATLLFWTITGPTALDSLNSLSGTVAYRNVVDVRAAALSGKATQVFSSTAVNFDTATVSGKFYVHMGNGDAWEMDFGGDFLDAVLNLQVDSATSKAKLADGSEFSATGTLDAALTGSGASAIGGVFDFQTTGSTFRDVDGAFLLDNTPVGDLRLTSAEQLSLDRSGWAVVHVQPEGYLLSGTASSGAGGMPILVSNALGTSGYPSAVVRVGQATPTNLGSTTVSGSAVHWGAWDAMVTTPAFEQFNADDPLLRRPIVSPAVAWMTAVTTPASVLQNHAIGAKTGFWSGPAASAFGEDHTGAAVSTLTFNANINFATGAVTGASLNTTAGAGTWSAVFSNSTLAGGTLLMDVNPAASSVSGLAGGTQSIAGQMTGGFVGNNAEGIAGVFHLHTEADTLVQLNGGLVTTGVITP